MQPRSKGALWSNDAGTGAAQPAPAAAAAAQGKRGSKRPLPDADEGAEEDDEEYQELPSARRKGAPGFRA